MPRESLNARFERLCRSKQGPRKNGVRKERVREVLALLGAITTTSSTLTERYAHLKPDLFSARDLGAIRVDLSPGASKAAPLRAGSDARMTPGAPEGHLSAYDYRENAGAAL